jgi:hypothetical protein
MKSPEFGPLCQMKRKDIMAPSDPVEVCQMSNFKSPCVCDNCMDMKVQQVEINNPFCVMSPKVVEKTFEEEINFESLCKQQELLGELKDLLELRPSVVQNYKKSFTSSGHEELPHAIEGLSSDARVRI